MGGGGQGGGEKGTTSADYNKSRYAVMRCGNEVGAGLSKGFAAIKTDSYINTTLCIYNVCQRIANGLPNFCATKRLTGCVSHAMFVVLFVIVNQFWRGERFPRLFARLHFYRRLNHGTIYSRPALARASHAPPYR